MTIMTVVVDVKSSSKVEAQTPPPVSDKKKKKYLKILLVDFKIGYTLWIPDFVNHADSAQIISSFNLYTIVHSKKGFSLALYMEPHIILQGTKTSSVKVV